MTEIRFTSIWSFALGVCSATAAAAVVGPPWPYALGAVTYAAFATTKAWWEARR